MIKIMFLARSLDIGGAERQLVELACGLADTSHKIIIVTFYPGGALETEAKSCDNVKLVCLNKASRWDLLAFFRRLHRLVRQEKPDLIYSFLDVANIFALLVGKLNNRRVVLGLRNSNVDFSRYDWTAGITYRIGAILSHFADAIIVNSYAGRSYHSRRGYSNNMRVIPNGIDVHRYYVSRGKGERMRTSWGISKSTFLFGLVGRLDPMKDHPTFLKAAAAMAKSGADVAFVCIGGGEPGYLNELMAMADDLGLQGSLTWAGQSTDIINVYNSLDCLISSSSYGEGFSNTVAEAMACGVPCIVTNVGDSALIINGAGYVVPPRDPARLAAAMRQIFSIHSKRRLELGEEARKRIVGLYSKEIMINRTRSLIHEIISRTMRCSMPSTDRA